MGKQYIGARYVPKFMGEYDITQVYEGLCVVDNGSGTSYISKKPTPAGTPLTNREYWTVYGSASGAIVDLQNQIDNIIDVDLPALQAELQGEIDTITTVDLPALQAEIDDINSRWVRPEDFGAVGDGVADDTSAFQDALDTHKNIFLTGKYLITSDLTINHRGTQSEYEKQLIFGGRIILQDCSFHGNIRYDGGLIFFDVVFTSDGHYTTPAFILDQRLIRMKFMLCKFRLIDYPIDLTNGADDFSQEYNFIECHFQDGVIAFNMDYSQFAGKIINCDINNYSSHGIYMGNNIIAQNLVINGNTIENCGAGIKLNHVLRAVVVEKCYFEGNTNASIDLTFLESDTGASLNGVVIRENYAYLNNDKDGFFMPYRIVNRLSTYINGSLIPITFERNALLRGGSQVRDSFYFPNGTPNNYSLDFKFNGNIPSAIQPYLHAYDVLMVHSDYTADASHSEGEVITLASNSDILSLIGRSAMPKDFSATIRNASAPGTIYITSAGTVRYKLDNNISSGDVISWSFIYK